jgi:hypothetical protein
MTSQGLKQRRTSVECVTVVTVVQQLFLVAVNYIKTARNQAENNLI